VRCYSGMSLTNTQTDTDRLQRIAQRVRPLGAVERLFWLIDRHLPFHFVMTMQVGGSTTPSQWREALVRLQRRHPLLSVSIRENENGQAEFYTHADAPIALRVQNGGLSNWPREVEAELRQRFDPTVAPLARAVLLHQTDAAVLIISLHHSIADGMSGVYLIRDLMRALSGQDIGVQSIQNALDAVAQSDAFQAPPPAAPPSADFRAIRYVEGDEFKPIVEPLQISYDISNALRERARQEQTSVHGALLAALSLAGRECSGLWDRPRIRLSSPINVRPFFGIDESCGLFTSVGHSESDERSSDSFWDIARSAKEQLQPSLKREAVGSLFASISPIIAELDVSGAAQLGANFLQREAVMTNVGVAPFDPAFGALRLQSIWGPAVFHGFENDHVLGVASVRGEGICLLYTSLSPIPGLLKSMERILSRALPMERTVDAARR
jgi:hypothetical protein